MDFSLLHEILQTQRLFICSCVSKYYVDTAQYKRIFVLVAMSTLLIPFLHQIIGRALCGLLVTGMSKLHGC